MSEEKKPHEWTTEEALEKLFHPKVREHLKEAVEDANAKDEPAPKEGDAE